MVGAGLLVALVGAQRTAAAMQSTAPMNTGGDYTIANPRTGQSKAAKHRGEYFELLGPPKAGHYGDVNWSVDAPWFVRWWGGRRGCAEGAGSDLYGPVAMICMGGGSDVYGRAAGGSQLYGKGT